MQLELKRSSGSSHGGLLKQEEGKYLRRQTQTSLRALHTWIWPVLPLVPSDLLKHYCISFKSVLVNSLSTFELADLLHTDDCQS